MKNRVGILTWHYYENVGSNLQAYGLYMTIKKMGYHCNFINYQYKKFQDSFLKGILKKICIFIDNIFPFLLPNKYRFKALQFQNKYFPVTNKCFTFDDLKNLNDDFDIFVCGSDQIWSPIVFDEVYFLNFVDKEKYKFSYAPSIGSNYISKELVDNYKELLSSFDGISIREKKGKELLKELEYDAMQVLDPSFLLSKEEWMEITSNRICKDNYIFCYFLGENVHYREKVLDYAKKNNKKLIIYSSILNDKNYCNKHITKMGPKEFLSYILYADFVFTDSFHGVTLSLKFNKNFNVFLRFEENDKKNQNSRITNILSVLQLEDRLITKEKKLNINDVDYKLVNEKLNTLIDESKSFLSNQLKKGSKV